MLEGEIVTLRERAAYAFDSRLDLSAGRFHKDSAVLWVQEWKPFRISTLCVRAGQEILIRGHLIRVLEVNPHNVRPYLRLEVVAPIANSLSGRSRNYRHFSTDHRDMEFSWRNRNARQ